MPSEEHQYCSASAVPAYHSAPETKRVAPQSWNMLGFKHLSSQKAALPLKKESPSCFVHHFQHCSHIYAGIGIYMVYAKKRELIEV